MIGLKVPWDNWGKVIQGRRHARVSDGGRNKPVLTGRLGKWKDLDD